MKFSALALGLALPIFPAAALAATPLMTITSLSAPYPAVGSVEKLEPALDRLLAPDAKIEKLAEGFDWSEGPAWNFAKAELLFSDVPTNRVYRWKEGEGVSVFLEPSGFTGERYEGRERGSNGLTFDRENRLVLCQHGDRRVSRLSSDGKGFIPLAERWEGKQFNSPNDLCFDRAGNLYFTDPPYGLDPKVTREIDFCGVYRLDVNGQLTLIARDLERPNGLALSPDERTLYVANSHGPRPIIMAFPLAPDGTAGPGKVFWDSTDLIARTQRRGGMDGLKVDTAGNLWATGPGGVLIIDTQGRLLGSILTGRGTANCTFGDADGRTLYITADEALLRIRTLVTDAARAPAR